MSTTYPLLVKFESFPPLLIPMLLYRDTSNSKIPLGETHPGKEIADIVVPINLNVRYPTLTHVISSKTGHSMLDEYISIVPINHEARNNLNSIMKMCLFAVSPMDSPTTFSPLTRVLSSCRVIILLSTERTLLANP